MYVEPADIGEAADGLRQLWQERVPTTVGASGTRLPNSGRSETVISLHRLNRIVRVDVENSAVIAEAGVPVGVLRDAVELVGLWCPAMRWLPAEELLGAAVAGGHGRRSLRYGAVADYLLGASFVCPSTGLTRHGGLAIKNATGYNLSGAVTGSRGDLAVILEVIIRLVPHSKGRALRFFRNSESSRGWNAVKQLSAATRGVDPRHDILRSVMAIETWAAFDGDEARLLVETDYHESDETANEFDAIAKHFGLLEAIVSTNVAWPPSVAVRIPVVHRTAQDPRYVVDRATAVLTTARRFGAAGWVLAETTGGAIDTGIGGEAAAIDEVVRLLGNSTAKSTTSDFRVALKQAFDPGGLLLAN